MVLLKDRIEEGVMTQTMQMVYYFTERAEEITGFVGVRCEALSSELQAQTLDDETKQVHSATQDRERCAEESNYSSSATDDPGSVYDRAVPVTRRRRPRRLSAVSLQQLLGALPERCHDARGVWPASHGIA
eukprot:TRINITY_DN10640_c0_g1_i2.p1 TRINITY_DN10640_c0_g1~~TRINITY_DN10640_c0_g1_i2.p1  ORF type:complete len:131 (+),score=17.69 TRINITY_DN10640_c0_g1_i2:550-942(+)